MIGYLNKICMIFDFLVEPKTVIKRQTKKTRNEIDIIRINTHTHIYCNYDLNLNYCKYISAIDATHYYKKETISYIRI